MRILYHLLLYATALGWLTSCTVAFKLKNKYYTKVGSETLRHILSESGTTVDSLMLDSTYQLYVRQVCRPRPAAGFYTSGRPNTPAALDRCNCEDATAGYDKEKLEVEYLLLSQAHNRFVYISTVPPAVINSGIRYDQPLYKVDNFVNIEAFNTFFFGRQSGHELLLSPATTIPGTPVSQPERWLFSFATDNSFLTIDTIIQPRKGYDTHAEPAAVLALPLRFYRKPDWRIGLSRKQTATTLAAAEVHWLRGNWLYIVYQNKRHAVTVDKVVFRFQDALNKVTKPSGDILFTGLYFSGNRVKSLAEPNQP